MLGPLYCHHRQREGLADQTSDSELLAKAAGMAKKPFRNLVQADSCTISYSRRYDGEVTIHELTMCTDRFYHSSVAVATGAPPSPSASPSASSASSSASLSSSKSSLEPSSGM